MFHIFIDFTVLRKAQFKMHLTNCKQKKEKIQSSQRTAAPMVVIGNTTLPSGSDQSAPLLQVEPQPSPREPHTFVSSTPINNPSQSQVIKEQSLASPLSTNQRLPLASDQSVPLLQFQHSPSQPHAFVSPKDHVPSG